MNEIVFTERDGVLSELFELIYTSVTPTRLSDDAVTDILSQARENNKAQNITGLLYYNGQRFLQIIEGCESDIEALYDSITRDDRHQDVELLHKDHIEARSFENWNMAYEALPNEKGEDVEDSLSIISFERLLRRRPSARGSIGAELFDLFIKSEQASADTRPKTDA